MRKIISASLAAVIILLSLFSLAGCGDGDYPVTVANLTIKSRPMAITVLDPGVADIISYIGYDTTMVCRSDEVDQKYMQVVPSVGSEQEPNISSIVSHGTEIVFASDRLSDETKAELEKNNIKVVRVTLAQDAKQLETNYRTLGKILGGATTGDNKGASSYSKLIDSMGEMKAKVSGSEVLNTACYLYLDENNRLCHTISGTYGDMLLGYTGAVNVAVNIDDNLVDTNTLKVANPNYIFYADDSTLKAVTSDGVLSKLAAIKGKKYLQVSNAEMTRQGFTALETIEKMINFMHPELAKTPAETTAPAATQAGTQSTTQAATQATNATAATQAATQTATQPSTGAAEAKSVADDYKIKLDGLSLKYEDDNDNVKAMQQRLFDLGYVDDKENITGYYGDISKAAVTEFQKKNGIKESGTADNETLTKLFSSDAVKK